MKLLQLSFLTATILFRFTPSTGLAQVGKTVRDSIKSAGCVVSLNGTFQSIIVSAHLHHLPTKSGVWIFIPQLVKFTKDPIFVRQE